MTLVVEDALPVHGKTPRKEEMMRSKLLRTVAIAAFLSGAAVAAVPAEVTAATCSADSGAVCECSGGCEATKLYCWCKPPAE